jgi:hypothetical protein
MKRRTIFLLILLLYISIYSTYNLQIVSTLTSINETMQKIEISKIFVVLLGLIGNVFILLIMVNLNWLITSLGITLNRVENIDQYSNVKKIDYYIMYFGIYSLNFLLLIGIAIFQWSSFNQNFDYILRLVNTIIIILTFALIMLYMQRRKILTKFSIIGVSLLNLVNLGYTCFH